MSEIIIKINDKKEISIWVDEKPIGLIQKLKLIADTEDNFYPKLQLSFLNYDEFGGKNHTEHWDRQQEEDINLIKSIYKYTVIKYINPFKKKLSRDKRKTLTKMPPVDRVNTEFDKIIIPTEEEQKDAINKIKEYVESDQFKRFTDVEENK